MEIITLATTLHGYWKGIEGLKSYVVRDMTNILSLIDKVNYDSAIRALKDSRNSSDPDNHIRSAITNLRTSFVAAEKRIKSMNWFERNLYGTFDSHESAYQSALTISACYRTLRDTNLEVSYLKEARKHLEIVYESVKNMDIFLMLPKTKKAEPARRREIEKFASIYAISVGGKIPPTTSAFVIGGVSYIDGSGYCTDCRKRFSIQYSLHTSSSHPATPGSGYNDCGCAICLHCPKCGTHLRQIQAGPYDKAYMP